MMDPDDSGRIVAQGLRRQVFLSVTTTYTRRSMEMALRTYLQFAQAKPVLDLKPWLMLKSART